LAIFNDGKDGPSLVSELSFTRGVDVFA